MEQYLLTPHLLQEEEDPNQVRNIILLAVNSVILITYVICMSLMLVKIKCRLPRTAMVVVFSYLLVFVPKVISDIMRVTGVGVEGSIVNRSLTFLEAINIGCERFKDIAIQVLIMTFDEFRIRILSQSLQDMQAKLKRHRVTWIAIITASALTVAAIIALAILIIVKGDINDLAYWIWISAGCLGVLIDFIVLVFFSKQLRFYRTYKVQKGT
jgi:hypothetical protein